MKPATPLTGLLPLEPPPAPAPPWWDGLTPLLPLALLAVALLAWWRRPAGRRARALRRLGARATRADADPRALARELEGLLRDRLGDKRPWHDAPPPGVNPADWQRLMAALHQARFAATPALAELRAVLPLARRVLRA